MVGKIEDVAPLAAQRHVTVMNMIRDMVRVNAANPILMTDPANPNPTDPTHHTDPNGGGGEGETSSVSRSYHYGYGKGTHEHYECEIVSNAYLYFPH